MSEEDEPDELARFFFGKTFFTDSIRSIFHYLRSYLFFGRWLDEKLVVAGITQHHGKNGGGRSRNAIEKINWTLSVVELINILDFATKVATDFEIPDVETPTLTNENIPSFCANSCCMSRSLHRQEEEEIKPKTTQEDGNEEKELSQEI